MRGLCGELHAAGAPKWDLNEEDLCSGVMDISYPAHGTGGSGRKCPFGTYCTPRLGRRTCQLWHHHVRQYHVGVADDLPVHLHGRWTFVMYIVWTPLTRGAGYTLSP